MYVPAWSKRTELFDGTGDALLLSNTPVFQNPLPCVDGVSEAGVPPA